MSLFITFEGPEGSGKTTQIGLLDAALTGLRHTVVTTREPGGTRIGEAVRAVLLDAAHTEMSDRAEALLFNAARAQLVDQVIRPALGMGAVVLCDRYGDSTVAYQGYGHGRPIEPLRRLIAYATDNLVPNLTIYLDLDVRQGLARKRAGAAGEWNRIEEKALAYHEAVRAGYLEMAAADPRWLVVDAAQPAAAIHNQIMARVATALDRIAA